MNTSNFLNADWWIKLAFRNFVIILCILLFVSLAAHAPFGPFLVLGVFVYIAFRIWTVGPAPESEFFAKAGLARVPKNATMKLLSNQSSLSPRSSTTSRQAKPSAINKIPT